MMYYQKNTSEVLKELNVNERIGLSKNEVDQRTLIYGKNEFQTKKPKNILVQILFQLKDISIIVLLIAAGLGLALAINEGHGFIEPFVILAIVTSNVILAVVQERGAEKALDALSALSSPSCKVLRDGKIQEIKTALLVPGDIIYIKTGDLVSADAFLLKSESLMVDESSLTGESIPVEKDYQYQVSEDVPLGDRLNMIHSGTLVTSGNGIAVVVETGMNTQMGKIAGFLVGEKKLKTPLQMRLDNVGKIVSTIAILSSLVMLVAGLLQGHDLWTMALVAVTLAVAAVPETLSLIVTLILTHGVKNMVKSNALIRKLQAVETLGSTSIICSDKTGTLTMNQMAVKRLWVLGMPDISDENLNSQESTNQDLTNQDMNPQVLTNQDMNPQVLTNQDMNPQVLIYQYQQLLNDLVLASNATIGIDDDGVEKIIGDPTETAILRLFSKQNLSLTDLNQKYPRVLEIPFSSARKMMTVVVKDPQGGYLVLSKGAFDRIPLKELALETKHAAELIHDQFASNALRIITLASKHLSHLPDQNDLMAIESDLEFRGFVGIIDPPRPEAASAIKRAKSAGIRTIMITGDHSATAAAIARELKIISYKEGIITGQELDKLSDDELNDSIEFYSVYARVSPEDKIRIVKALQLRGEVVAMTGDGVNDAPALTAADVGVAMGINGTEVSKSASDMILMDDLFSTIIDAVAEGRNVFSNIRKLVYFLIVCNISEIIIMLFAQFMRWPLPLTPMMLLLINVVGDGIPGMALAKEVSDPRIMSRRPIERNEGFFSGGIMDVIIRQTFMFVVVSLIAFYIGCNISLLGSTPSIEVGRTMTFLVTGLTSIIHIFTARSRKSIFTYKIKDNPQLYLSALAMIILFILLVITPVVSTNLGFCSLSLYHWLIVIGLVLVPTIVAEYFKFWDNVKHKVVEKNRVK